MSDINRKCKECGAFVKDTHEGVPFVDGTAMCMNCFREDYKHIGQKVMDAMKRSGLFDEEIETSDEQWFDDPEWIEMNRGDPFEQAWDSIVKIDEGMWEEIYAPLYEVLGGRGKNKIAGAGGASPLDFVPTDMLSPSRHFQGKPPSNWGSGEAKVERLMESIMEHGMLGRDSDWWKYQEDEDPVEEGRKRYDRVAAGKSSVGNVAIPQLNFNPAGWMIGEGNHRVEALRRMNAPYIPAYMISSTWNQKLKNPQYHYDPEMIYGEDMRRLMGLKSNRYATLPHINPQLAEDYPDQFNHNFNEEHRRAIGGYGIPASFGRRRDAVPPSFFFGRELVPGMGQLVPDIRGGFTAKDIPMNELRSYDTSWGEKANDPTGAFREFQDNLHWKVI